MEKSTYMHSITHSLTQLIWRAGNQSFCFKIVSSAHKIMVTVFWHAEAILLTDYLEHGSTRCDHQHILTSSSGCHEACLVWTTPPPTVLATSDTKWLLFVSKAERIRKRMWTFWWWGYHMYSKWLVERAGWTILVQRNVCFGERLDQVHISCRRLCFVYLCSCFLC